jgi:hypothetical protein
MPRMGFGLQQSQRQRELHQRVHAAAWSTYVHPPNRRNSARERHAPARYDHQPLADALQSLDDLSSDILQENDRTSLMLVGTALWNLLDVYRNKTPPKEFAKLLLDILTLDFEQARDLHIQPRYRVFPPFPDDLRRPTPLVIDSSFTARRNKKTSLYRAHVSLQLCVERDFETLKALARPERWSDFCPAIWGHMRQAEGGWKGGLVLPRVGDSELIDVTFVDLTATEPDAAREEAELQIVAPGVIEGGLWKLRMAPERSRPGWTRIVHDRDVTFSPDLQPYELPTLAYWTKSEVACLAFHD